MRIADKYVIQQHTKACTSESMLATINECSNAKTVLDPNAGTVEREDFADAPKGCSRYQGKWFFNTHETGALDKESEPICKAGTDTREVVGQ